MEENLAILENWYQSLHPIKELRISEVKYLFKKYMEVKEERIRKKLRDVLVLGTLHFIYRQLQMLFSCYVPSGDIAMEDIIQTSCEIWIENLLSGKVLSASQYESFLQNCFYKRMEKILLPESFSYQALFNLNRSDFFSLLIQYIHFRKENSSFGRNTMDFPFSVLFEDVYSYLETSGLFLDRQSVAEEQLLTILPFALHQVYLKHYNFKDQSDKICKMEMTLDFVEKEALENQVRERYENLQFPSLRDKKIVWELMEIGEENIKDLACAYDLAPARIRKIKKQICKQIRKFDGSAHELENLYEEISK